MSTQTTNTMMGFPHGGTPAEQATRSVACGDTQQGFVWLWCDSRLDFGDVGCSTNARQGSNPVGAAGQFASGEVRIYPNPATHTLTVTAKEEYQITLYDLAGRPVMHHDRLQGKATLDVSHLRPGVYLLNTRDASGQSRQQRIVIQ